MTYLLARNIELWFQYVFLSTSLRAKERERTREVNVCVCVCAQQGRMRFPTKIQNKSHDKHRWGARLWPKSTRSSTLCDTLSGSPRFLNENAHFFIYTYICMYTVWIGPCCSCWALCVCNRFRIEMGENLPVILYLYSIYSYRFLDLNNSIGTT